MNKLVNIGCTCVQYRNPNIVSDNTAYIRSNCLSNHHTPEASSRTSSNPFISCDSITAGCSSSLDKIYTPEEHLHTPSRKPKLLSSDSEEDWGWWNEQIPYIPSLRHCKNSGCTYEDTDKKCQKHQTYFCRLNNVCRICSEVVRIPLMAHYTSKHANITFWSGSVWRAQRTGWRWFLIDSVAVCRYRLSTTRFDLDVWSSADCKQLQRKSTCALRLTDPDTDHTLFFNLDTLFDVWVDWRIKVDTSRFPSWSRKLDVSVNILF